MNQPFSILGDWVRDGRLKLADPGAETPSAFPDDLSDDDLFAFAMSDVHALGWSAVSADPRPPVEIRMRDREQDALDALETLLRGGQVDLERSQEYIEKSVQPVGRLYLNDLRRGRFSVQAHLDLHGFDPVDARILLEDFLAEARKKRLTCIRIVHGRGLHSNKDMPILKQNIQRWLATRRMSRFVIAYSSARLCDGGGGAIYVLLRV